MTLTTVVSADAEVSGGWPDASGGNVAAVKTGYVVGSNIAVSTLHKTAGAQAFAHTGASVDVLAKDLGSAKSDLIATGTVILYGDGELLPYVRGNGSVWAGLTAYALYLDASAGFGLFKRVAGNLGSPIAGIIGAANIAVDTPYRYELSAIGQSPCVVSANVQRILDSQWLQADGTFGASKPVAALTYSDSSPIASGQFAGISLYQLVYADEWLVQEQSAGVTPAITSVDVTPDTATATDQTPIQFTENTVSVGGAPTAGTWSCTAGSITTSGLYTPPSRTSGIQSPTVRFTSTFDSSKFNDSVVTIPALPPAPATSYLLTGAGTGTVGAAQTLTLTLVGGGYSGAIALSDGAGGAFSPSSPAWSNESGAKTVQYTPGTAGARTISATANPTLGTNQTLSVVVSAVPVTTGVKIDSGSIQLPIAGDVWIKVISQTGIVKVARTTAGVLAIPNTTNRYLATLTFVQAAGDIAEWSDDNQTLLASGVYVPSDPGAGTRGGAASHSVSLPLAVSALNTIALREGDNGPSRQVQLTDAQSRPYPIPGTATIIYRLKRRGVSGRVNPLPDQEPIEGAAVIVSASFGVVRFDFTTETPLPIAGNYDEEWVIDDTEGATGQRVSFPGDGYVPVVIKPPLV